MRATLLLSIPLVAAAACRPQAASRVPAEPPARQAEAPAGPDEPPVAKEHDRAPLVEPRLQRAPDVPPRPMPELATAGTLHVIVVDAGVARCEAWEVVPDPEVHGNGLLVTRWTEGTATAVLTHSYASDGDVLRITGASRDTTFDDASGAGIATGCFTSLTARRLADRIDVQGAAWFPTADACAAAVAAGDPVATDFGACTVPRHAVSAGVERDGRARLIQRLRDGGGLWSLAEGLTATGDPDGVLTCRRLDVVPDEDAEAIAGELRRALVDADGNRGVEGTSYAYDGARWMTLLGPGETWTSADGTQQWTRALGCTVQGHVEILAEDTVEITLPYHLTLAACERARDHELERRRWLPPDHVVVVGGALAMSGGQLPGC